MWAGRCESGVCTPVEVKVDCVQAEECRAQSQAQPEALELPPRRQVEQAATREQDGGDGGGEGAEEDEPHDR